MTSMKIGVFGTGSVGRALGAKLSELGHQVMLGTRDPSATRERSTPDAQGNAPLREWLEGHAALRLGTFQETAAHGELLVNATSGSGTLPALGQADPAELAGKVLIDVANPLDFSKGMPPSLTVCNTDSLGESIQRAFPSLRVVKTLNTVTAALMVDPSAVAGGEHTIFVSGNDAAAKATVSELLRSFGWRDIVDLGDITTARGTEMFLPLWVRLWPVTKTALFSFKLVR